MLNFSTKGQKDYPRWRGFCALQAWVLCLFLGAFGADQQLRAKGEKEVWLWHFPWFDIGLVCLFGLAWSAWSVLLLFVFLF